MSNLSSTTTISKEEILRRFGEVVRNYIVSQMTHDANTIWVASFTAGSITLGDTPSGKAVVGVSPDLPDPNAINDVVKADVVDTSAILRVLRDTLVIYARNQQVFFNNTGNLGSSGSAKLRLTTSNGLDGNMESQIQAAIDNSPQLQKDQTIQAAVWESFFLDCRNVWNGLCNSGNIVTYNFYYCHSSFSQHSSHSSRGRR